MILDGMSSLSFCEREGILRTFKIIYLLLNIIRVLVPVIIIIIGTKDLMNAVLQSNTDEMKKAPSIFIKRLIAGLIIFLIPSLLDTVFNMVASYENNPTEFAGCSVCLTNGNDCDTLMEVAKATELSIKASERRASQEANEITDADIANWEKHKAERLKRQQENKNNPNNNNNNNNNSNIPNTNTYTTTVTNGESKYFNSKNVTQISGLTEQELVSILQRNTAYKGKAKVYLQIAHDLILAERNHGVNAFYLMGLYSYESGWMGSALTKNCNNIGGVRFYNQTYGNGKKTTNCNSGYAGFDSISEFIDFHANLLEKKYLTPGGSHYYGTSVADVAKDYGAGNGIDTIIRIATRVSTEY